MRPEGFLEDVDLLASGSCLERQFDLSACGVGNPETSRPASVARPAAILRMLCRVRLRRPRSTWPTKVQCNPDCSASFSWLHPSWWRRARTRRPNSTAAAETGSRGAGMIGQAHTSHAFQSRDDTSHDLASWPDWSYGLGPFVRGGTRPGRRTRWAATDLPTVPSWARRRARYAVLVWWARSLMVALVPVSRSRVQTNTSPARGNSQPS